MQKLFGPLDAPIWNLVTCFLGWKALLLLIAFGSPGPGYDTSTSLILPNYSSKLLHSGIEKLTRWDAIYFVKVSSRGYQYEQEWAFGWGFTRVIASCIAGLEEVGLHRSDELAGLIGVFIAHLAHLLSVLVLYLLTLAIFPRFSRMLAYTTAAIHIISPAGLFLSAPYAESSCALLSFAGTLAFSRSFTAEESFKNLFILLSGFLFGIATTFRSNGILSGLLLLEEAIKLLLTLSKGIKSVQVWRLLSTGAAGILVGVGFILPQSIAYFEYCGVNVLGRPWCERTLPSIYVFVQDHYWNNGLFRYWTISNLPLFLLGAPMFAILCTSSRWVLITNLKHQPKNATNKKHKSSPKKISDERDTASAAVSDGASSQILYNLALQQFLLALYTFTTAHVQIISRISSAYPVWMWYFASLLQVQNTNVVRVLIRYIVIYAVVQAGLYAAFLPPA